MKLTRQQLQNDLDAARRREEILQRELEQLRSTQQLTDAVFAKQTNDLNDWKTAFKTISKLVK